MGSGDDIGVGAVPSRPGSSASNPPIPWLGLGAATATVGIALGVYNPFIAVTLSAKGFDVATIGILAAIASIGFVVGTPIWGQLADTRFGRPRALAIAGAAGGLILATIWFPVPAALVALLFLAGSLFLTAWLSLVDAIVVNAVHDSRRYARLRLISSFTYAVSALVGGIVYASTGFELSLMLVAVGGVALAIVALRLPDVARARAEPGTGRSPSWWSTATAPLHLLRGTPGLPLALLAIALALPRLHGRQHVHGPVPARAGRQRHGRRLRVGDLRGDRGPDHLRRRDRGLPVRHPDPVRDRRHVRRRRASRAGRSPPGSRSSSSADCSRASATAGCSSPGVMAVHHFLPPERQATGQGLLQATCFGASAVIVNVLGGQLHAVIGYRGLFATCAVVGLVGIAIGWRALPGRPLVALAQWQSIGLWLRRLRVRAP